MKKENSDIAQTAPWRVLSRHILKQPHSSVLDTPSFISALLWVTDDERKITGLISELAKAAQGGPGRGQVQCAATTTLVTTASHTDQTRPLLDRWRNGASSSMPSGNGSSRPAASHRCSLLSGSSWGTEQRALPRAAAWKRASFSRASSSRGTGV